MWLRPSVVDKMLVYTSICLFLSVSHPLLSQAQDSSRQECEEKADIVFLIDSSLSVREESDDNWDHIKNFTTRVIDQLPISSGDIRIGLVKFSTTVDENEVIHFSSSPDFASLREKVRGLTFMGGNTNTSGAFRKMTESLLTAAKGDREDVRNIAVLITDGLSNIDANLTLPEARFAKVNHKVRMFTVAITKYANTGELQEISSDPVSYHYLMSENFQTLSLLVDQLLSRLCKAKIPPTTPCQDTRADIAFLLDSSGSIRMKNPNNETDNWDILRQFVVSTIRNLEVRQDHTRISVIRYSDRAEVIFKLDEYDDVDEMIKTVADLPYEDYTTNTAAALRMMRTQVFQKRFGDRPDVRNIGVIITDGESNEERNMTEIEAAKVKAAHTRMFAIGLTEDVDIDELTAIVSKPMVDHYFNKSVISDVTKLLDRLVYSLCQRDTSRCPLDDDNCTRTDDPTFRGCRRGESLEWRTYRNRLLVGHNYGRVQNIDSPEDCQRLCLSDARCRSVDYVHFYKECAVSYVTKAEAEMNFVPQYGVDYSELICVAKQ